MFQTPFSVFIASILRSCGRPHLIAEGGTVRDLCHISHHPSPPFARQRRTGRGPARTAPAFTGAVVWGGALLHQFFKVQGGRAGWSGGSSATRRRMDGRRSTSRRGSRQGKVLTSLSPWGEFKRPPSGTQWFYPERPRPDRTGCGCRIYGPGRFPRHYGSNIRPGPGSD